MSCAQDRFRAIVSGRQRGLKASGIRAALRPIAAIYGMGIRARNRLYEIGLAPVARVGALVISVGNITAGGTGKTPMVAWLFAQLTDRFCLRPDKIAILIRGYKAGPNPYRDEPLLLQRACEGGLVVVDPDRVRGARSAINNGARILILDDGFQHRRIARDLDILTVDCTCPFGYGKLLPAGLLREPIGGIARADAVVLTRSDQAGPEAISAIRTTLERINPNLVVARSTHRPTAVVTAEAHPIGPEELAGIPVYAFCGTANPQAFFETLRALGARLVGTQVFGDHHRFTSQEISAIYKTATARRAQMILTTQKNWLGLDQNWFEDGVTCAYLQVRLDLIEGEQALLELIRTKLAAKRPSTDQISMV